MIETSIKYYERNYPSRDTIIFHLSLVVKTYKFFLLFPSQTEQYNRYHYHHHYTSSGRTARERWKLFKNISRLGLQRVNITEDDHLSSVSLIEFKLVCWR
jgi:hypothetical protein